jgi:hypothetical protein
MLMMRVTHHCLPFLSLSLCVDRQVYWDNGCQIVAPHDKGIAKCIEENLQPWDIDVDALLKKAKSSAIAAFCRRRIVMSLTLHSLWHTEC